MKGDKCSHLHCNNPAIGYESMTRSLGLNVCEKHASNVLLNMQPGTTQNNVNHYAARYSR